MPEIVVVDGKAYIDGPFTVPSVSRTANCPSCGSPPRHAIDVDFAYQIVHKTTRGSYAYSEIRSDDSEYEGLTYQGLPVLACIGCDTSFVTNIISDLA